MIRIQNITKRFRKFPALDSIDADFDKGQVISLIGPNGSGKTTLIKAILGLVTADSGTITFGGLPVTENDTYRSHIGYMPQIGRFPDNMKVGQLFGMIKNLRSDARELDEELFYKFKLDTIMNKSLRSLSGGTRQKVSAALAFLFNPVVLILDEPTAGLDPLSSETLKEKNYFGKAEGQTYPDYFAYSNRPGRDHEPCHVPAGWKKDFFPAHRGIAEGNRRRKVKQDHCPHDEEWPTKKGNVLSENSKLKNPSLTSMIQVGL